MFKFKKIASILTSSVMLTSTVALAAAANYPAPFVTGGDADVALVWGSTAANTDLAAVVDITNSLNSFVTGGTVTKGSSVSGEAYPLFTSGSPLLLNSTLDSVRQVISKSHMPVLLADGKFQTTTNIDYTQKIYLGRNPIVSYKQQPTSSDDPVIGLELSTTPGSNYIYNATINFDESVNFFNNTDSTGEELVMFGQTYTVSAATTATKLILLKSSQTISLSDTDPSAEIVVEGKTYTVELVSASDTQARVRVTDSSGGSDSKTITTDNSKTIQGIEVGVTYANENAAGPFEADLTVGSNRLTIQDGSTVKFGTDDKTIDGTNVEVYTAGGQSYNGGNYSFATVGKIEFQVAAKDSDSDAVFPGGEFVDSIFGSFKLDFSGITVPADSTKRDEIKFLNSGTDKMTISFQPHDGSSVQSIEYILNDSSTQVPGSMDLADNDAKRFIVAEGQWANRSEYIIFPSDEGGGLYQVKEIYNDSSTFSEDYVVFKNVLTDEGEIKMIADSEGTITGEIQDQSVTVTYTGDSSLDSDSKRVRVNFGESTTDEAMIWPTIATRYGAKIAFVEPTTINVLNWDNQYDGDSNLTGLTFQDGDGYTDITATIFEEIGGGPIVNLSLSGGTITALNTSLQNTSATFAIGQYNVNISVPSTAAFGHGNITIALSNPQDSTVLARPAVLIIEEKDDASNYQALVVTHDGGNDDVSAGVGVADVVRTWSADTLNNEQQHDATDSDLYSDMDLWGTIMTLDKSDSNDITATISYPDEQVESLLYLAEVSAAITAGSSSSGGGASNILPISDSEIGSAAGMNLIVVGGTCINTVAADLLGVADKTCGAGFTAATDVSAGQFLIQTFDRSGGAVATLVAGYNAADTTNGAKFLTTQTPSTDVDAKYVGTSSTSAEMVTTTTTADADATA